MAYSGAPAFYDHINATVASVSPNTVHVKNVGLYNFFAKYLLQKCMSVFKFRLPKTWSRDYLLYCLFCWGRVAIINTDKYGVIPQGCGLQGYNIFYEPTNATISNPLLRGLLTPRIGSECVVLKLQPNYGSIMDLVSFYAQELALAAEAVDVNLLNTKLAFGFAASSKTAAESFKKLYDNIASGEPMVVYDKSLLNDDGSPSWQLFNQDLATTYVADKILLNMRQIEAEFDTKVGIPNANTDKKERLISDEVNANNVETQTLAELWLDSLKAGCKQANAMFGIRISVDWRVKPQTAEVKEVATDEG